MHFIEPDWPGMPPNVCAISTLRSGGVSRAPYDDGAGGGGWNLGVHVGDDPEAVEHNRRILRTIVPGDPAWLTQVHGATVVAAEEVSAAVEADACVATSGGAVCVIQTADCLPVLFCDKEGKVVGAAHAGWRGLAKGVLAHTVARMRQAGAGEITAWLGPAIGAQCFEVGQEVHDVFVTPNESARAAFQPICSRPGKYLADIYLLARLALVQTGVTAVSGGGLCTVSDARRFYSYRRDRITGRMASLIWLK